MKLSIFPRKISNTSNNYLNNDEENTEYERTKKGEKQKMSRVLSLDKQLFKTTRGQEKD